MDPSTLAERLRAIVRGPAVVPAGAQPGAAIVPSGQPANAPARPIDAVLGGEWHPLPSGACFIVERRVEPEARHGRDRVASIADTIAAGLPSAAVLDARAAARAPLLFFDLETTGLSGGAGTYAFLIGCGWFDEDRAFVTRQYVLTRLADERTVLLAFAGELARAGALVSFNGRTFDAPVLETRYAFHRLAWSGADLPHLDMLHPARRFWGVPRDGIEAAGHVVRSPGGHAGPPLQATDGADLRVGPSCSLTALERRVLDASRVGDVPGFEIPERYFQFLRSGDASPLASVLEHNRLDLLSLAAVTARLLAYVHEGSDAVEQATEALALGRLYARVRADGRAEAAFRRAVALAAADSTWVAVEALRALARGARRQRRYDEAAERWRDVLRVDGCPADAAHEAHEALAIYHEHRRRDLESARSFALRILEEPIRPAWEAAVRHRLARIERKMGLLDLDAGDS